jgi:multiple sugar transport system substrate-binding protein
MKSSTWIRGVGATALVLVLAPAGAFGQTAGERAIEAAQQYAGTTITVTWEAGLQALDPLNHSGPLWEELTGIRVQVVEIPIDELFTRTLAEHRAATGAYDLLNIVPAWMPDLAEAGALEPLDPFIDEFGYRDELDDILDVYRDNWMSYRDTIYGLPDDGDVLIMYYRRDLFGDEGHQAAFGERYGYDLAPPETWEQYKDISEYFTDAIGGTFYGSAAIRGPGHIHYFFQERFRNAGGRFFDPDTMEPLINSEHGVEVVEAMIAEHAHMPAGVETWGAVEVLNAWLAGDLAIMQWWPPPGRWSEGYGSREEALAWLPETQVAGKVGYALPPGGHPQLAAGWALSVAANSQNKEAAYLFAQWMNSREVSLERVMLPYTLRGPFRASHYESEVFAGLWPYADEYLDILRRGPQQGLLDLSIRNTFAYEESLSRAITAAFAGDNAQTVLDQAAAEWREITEQVGLEAQRAAYLEWASKPNAYPDN